MSNHSALSGPIEIEDHEKVALGQSGFLFQKFDQTFEQLCGDTQVGADQLGRWVSLIETRHAWLESRGIPYVFAITPEKHIAYPDCLPTGFRLNPDRPAIQILKSLSEKVRQSTAYYDTVLLNGRSIRDTFYRTDIHWTNFGACLAYNELASKAGGRLETINVEQLPMLERRFTGEFAFHLKDRISEQAFFLNYDPPRRSKKVFSRQSFKQGQVEVYETPGAPEGTLVFFRDSNGTAMLPFLLPQFSRSIVVASLRVFYEVLRSETCSLVISQMAERYLARVDDTGVIVHFPDDFGPLQFSATTGAPLPLPTPSADFEIDLRRGGNSGAFIQEGWSGPERNIRWAIGQRSVLKVPVQLLADVSTIEFTVIPFTDEANRPSQRATFSFNGKAQFTRSFQGPESVVLELPPDIAGAQDFIIAIDTPDAVAPKVVTDSVDDRELSFAFDSIFFRKRRA